METIFFYSSQLTEQTKLFFLDNYLSYADLGLIFNENDQFFLKKTECKKDYTIDISGVYHRSFSCSSFI